MLNTSSMKVTARRTRQCREIRRPGSADADETDHASGERGVGEADLGPENAVKPKSTVLPENSALRKLTEPRENMALRKLTLPPGKLASVKLTVPPENTAPLKSPPSKQRP